MAIEKNNFKVSRLDSEFSPGSRSKENMMSDDDDLHRPSPVESEDDDELDDADSGVGSDDFDLSELGESGTEICQVGDQTCCIPYELYDLPDLREVLSLDVWNECLTEEERFSLTQYLPDMDQDTYMHTLKELFECENLYFGSPITKLFEMFKGGLCEPRVSLYRSGLNFFQRHEHYHFLRNYQNSMVGNLLQIRDAWKNCKGYSVDEKARVLNIMRSQKSLMTENVQTDYSEEESVDHLRVRKSKARGLGQIAGNDTLYGVSPPLNFPSWGSMSAMETSIHSKKNPRGVLKVVSTKVPANRNIASSTHRHQQVLPPPHLSKLAKASGYESQALPWRIRDQMQCEDDSVDVAYGMDHQTDGNAPYGSFIGQSGHSKSRKKRQIDRGDEYVGEGDDHGTYGMNLNVNQLSDIKILTASGKPSSARASYDYGRKGKYLEPAYEDQMSLRVSSNGNHADFLDGTEPYRSKKTKEEVIFRETDFRYDEWDARGRKRKLGKDMSDAAKNFRIPQKEIDDRLLHSGSRMKPLVEKIRKTTVQNGGLKVASLKANRILSRGEETESDSSDELDEEEEDSNPLMMRKLDIPIHSLEHPRSSYTKSGVNVKGKLIKKGRKESDQTMGDLATNFAPIDDFSQHYQSPETGNYPLKSKRRVKMQQMNHLQSSSSQLREDEYFNQFNGLAKSKTEQSKKYSKKATKNSKMQAAAGGNSPLTLMKDSPAERRQKGASGNEFSVHSKYLEDYFAEDDDDDLFEDDQFDDSSQIAKTKAKDHDSAIIGCSSVGRKRKQKVISTGVDNDDTFDYKEPLQHEVSEFPPSKKRVKKKPEADRVTLDLEMPPPVTETITELDLEIKPKKTFILITPTVHKDFTFSIVHLLSAVRMSMVNPNPKDSTEVGKDVEKVDGTQKVIEDQGDRHQILDGSRDELDMDKPGQSEQNTPLLTVQEIVDFVTSNPGDPCILETQEPLQDLIRGVLKILSAKTAPLGAKGWKPLVGYEKSRKCWHWIGTVKSSPTDEQDLEPVTSPEAWGIPQKMLVKLVDAFANWLKSGQETLQQIGSLPAPPLELMQNNLDEKERFRDLRAQKSLTTINPSSEEVRAYFRKEELLRYSIPDRAFSYTAADGKKSIVAPLRRCGGKPTSKARDHPMLKRDRPPHVTILCLVRDAASRLPGSIGTRADVCTLIRDSQYMVEDVTDAQINQVVSGALDRLHYERDPCVLFDGERKLWVYLHREREEEDFEDDGTSSTKKWKRPKKDATEQGEQLSVTVAYTGSGDQAGFDLSSDLNADPSCAQNDKTEEVVYEDARQNSVENMESIQVEGSLPIAWENHVSDPVQDSELQCKENSTSKFFEGDSFAEDRDIGLLDANL
ncbi:hypothetical protein V2J09_019023 [Rumex salicifolius]